MAYTVPVFVDSDNVKIKDDFLRGIKLRLKRASTSETDKISIEEIESTPGKWKNKYKIGISMHDSDALQGVDTKDAILIAPLASAIKKKNILTLIDSTWEAKAIKKFLDMQGIEEDGIKLYTDLGEDSLYLKSFKEVLFENTQKKDFVLTQLGKVWTNSNIKAIVIVGMNKVKLGLDLVFIGKNLGVQIFDKLLSQSIQHIKNKVEQGINNLKQKIKKEIEKIKEEIPSVIRELEELYSPRPLIITTSSFEDWQISPFIRKQFAGFHYTYPRLTEEGIQITEEFQKHFGHKPSIISLLAYDGMDILINVVKKVPILSYEEISKELFHTVFNLKILGEMMFYQDTEGVIPVLINKTEEDLFTIKYIDQNGNYKTMEG